MNLTPLEVLKSATESSGMAMRADESLHNSCCCRYVFLVCAVYSGDLGSRRKNKYRSENAR